MLMNIPEFDTFFRECIKNTTKESHQFMGIVRAHYPKWEGWKIIRQYKKDKVPIENIDDANLLLLVENYYLVKYIKMFLCAENQN